AVLGAMATLFAISALGSLGRERFAASLAARAMHDVRSSLFAHLQCLSASFYSSHAMGDLHVRFTGDAALVESAIADALPRAVYKAVGVLVGIPLLFVFN